MEKETLREKKFGENFVNLWKFGNGGGKQYKNDYRVDKQGQNDGVYNLGGRKG